MNCKHKWKEDERFKSGGVIMLFGDVGDVHQETRLFCDKCESINYVSKKEAEEMTDGS